MQYKRKRGFFKVIGNSAIK